MIPDHPFDDYRDRRVLVMGLGSFGGGMGAVRFLVARGARVTVTDLRPPEKLAESLQELRDTPPDRLVLGHHDHADFREADLVVVNPAVKRDCPYLKSAVAAGVPLTSEMNLFWKWNPARVIAITGSNGKSTTTALTHAIVDQFVGRQSRRRAWLGGNIGQSLLPKVDEIQSDDLVVLELSSFQLADLDRMQISPNVAVVTNFAPNHLDWHATLEDYRHTKQTIVRWQSLSDVAVLNNDDQDVTGWATNGSQIGFGLNDEGQYGVYLEKFQAVIRSEAGEQYLPITSWLKLPGKHNLSNALAAIAAAVAVGADFESIQAGITNYRPLPHRLQFIAEVNGRQFYNDSLATTPESTEVALAAFDRPIVLLAGGYDKQVDLKPLAKTIAQRVKAVSLMGQTAATLRQLLISCDSTSFEVSSPQISFAEAFDWAIQNSASGDVVLLSPACASYDWFRNFADRGLQFEKMVHQYMIGPGSMALHVID